MKRSALFSTCRTYRYSLERIWDPSGPRVLFIGLNPSRADESADDPTIGRCIQFAKGWGFGGFCIVNLFAFCTPDPEELFAAEDPIGPKNDLILKRCISENEKAVLVWGNNGHLLKRNEMILKLIKKPLCLKMNKNGAPAHPLYLRSNLKLIPYPV